MDRPTVDQIQSFMDRHGLSETTTAQQSGISRRTLGRYMKHGTENADPSRVERLAGFMWRLDRRQASRQWLRRLGRVRYC